jgi:type IV secretory pathway VirD2 relaxase
MIWVVLGAFFGLFVGVAILIVLTKDRSQDAPQPKAATLKMHGIIKILNPRSGRVAFVADETKRQESFVVTADTRLVGFPDSPQEWAEKAKALELGQRVEVVYDADEEKAIQIRLLEARP